jgi:glycosyltransferase involved in cell wall biosynthesis
MTMIVINNFFSGILQRGIPIYAENLMIGIRESGQMVKMSTCPTFLNGLPRWILNLLFVINEQLIFPVATIFVSKTVYPFNSVSIIDSLMGRSLLIIHDFIPNHKSDRSLAALYIKLTQYIHSKLGGDVAFVSRSTEKIARRLNVFPISKKFYLPNSFYLFQDLAKNLSCSEGDYVLLCTGRGKNKDLVGALQLAYSSGLLSNSKIRVLGLAGDRSVIDKWCCANSIKSNRIFVCGKLSDFDVVKQYKSSRWVWVHSLSEGYGRSIAESKICGKYVLASDIPPFREQICASLFLYRGLDQFLGFTNHIEANISDGIKPSARLTEHADLRNGIDAIFSNFTY